MSENDTTLKNRNPELSLREKKERFDRLSKTAPEFFRTLAIATTLEEAREKAFEYSYALDRKLREGDLHLHRLEWDNAIESLHVFQNLLAKRNEMITGVSSLETLWLIARNDPNAVKKPVSMGFYEEMVHLLRGMHGKSGLNFEKDTPSFIKYEGRKAAKLRSHDLDNTSRYADSFMTCYKSGLDSEIVKIRRQNKARIMKYFGADENKWNDWKWQVRKVIKDSKTLSDLVEISEESRQAIDLAIRNRIPFGITPYYLTLMDRNLNSGYDLSIRSQVIPPLEYVRSISENRETYASDYDFMLERDTSPIDLVTRRYPKIAIFKPYNSCPQICVYCQRNWEIDEVNAPCALAPEDKIDAAINWFTEHPEVTEVLITGGDPMGLGKTRIENYLRRFSEMPHIERIRIGTRTPVTLPMRINQGFVDLIKRFHNPGRLEICLMTHFQHVSEITPEAADVIKKLRMTGISIYNQQVYTFFVSRRFETMALRRLLKNIGIDPYYTFNTKGKQEMSDYRVPIARILQERREETRLFPGTLRLDEPVYNVPRLGKNYLKAWQNHEIIMITPQGTRIYEFHPWEKNINPADTYCAEDISIYNYLRRLKEIGENLADYKTIWYYF